LRNDFAADEEFEPIGGFVQFLEAVTDLGDEFGFGTSALSFAVVCTNGCA
jgi:hypothetical protein